MDGWRFVEGYGVSKGREGPGHAKRQAPKLRREKQDPSRMSTQSVVLLWTIRGEEKNVVTKERGEGDKIGFSSGDSREREMGLTEAERPLIEITIHRSSRLVILRVCAACFLTYPLSAVVGSMETLVWIGNSARMSVLTSFIPSILALYHLARHPFDLAHPTLRGPIAQPTPSCRPSVQANLSSPLLSVRQRTPTSHPHHHRWWFSLHRLAQAPYSASDDRECERNSDSGPIDETRGSWSTYRGGTANAVERTETLEHVINLRPMVASPILQASPDALWLRAVQPFLSALLFACPSPLPRTPLRHPLILKRPGKLSSPAIPYHHPAWITRQPGLMTLDRRGVPGIRDLGSRGGETQDTYSERRHSLGETTAPPTTISINGAHERRVSTIEVAYPESTLPHDRCEVLKHDRCCLGGATGGAQLPGTVARVGTESTVPGGRTTPTKAPNTMNIIWTHAWALRPYLENRTGREREMEAFAVRLHALFFRPPLRVVLPSHAPGG
ncbi:hypothetical protein FA13DRAFT_1776265 [Coprinellus micaceus]|uniref:Uncharacterized protein n=1 Tax=Coprinellus micaceus TaxID=71717 RepID=A0A4Y7T214_COPMI|nr:hypothetical protein FA13DRAFT_1776265 [Coprinellus micaceus]